MRRLVAAVCLGAVAFAAVPVHAATWTVNVTSNAFDPASRVATSGDNIRFWWANGQHTVTAYEGATFDTGIRSPGFETSVPFAGTTIKYRCTLHSQVSQFGTCSGMCGIISKDAADTQPPTVAITSPKGREVVIPQPQLGGTALENTVRIAGVASDNDRVLAVLVRIYDTIGSGREVPATCQGCGSAVANFEVRQNLVPGSYVIEATAVDYSGNLRTSERTSFFVL